MCTVDPDGRSRIRGSKRIRLAVESRYPVKDKIVEMFRSRIERGEWRCRRGVEKKMARKVNKGERES